jgi:hypothetical protein
MTCCGHCTRRQLGRNFLDKHTKVRLTAGGLIQQVREPARPPLRRSLLELRRVGTRRSELLTGLRQPPLCHLGLPVIAPAQQPGESVPHRLPYIRDRRSSYRLTRKLRQRHQNITRHPATFPNATQRPDTRDHDRRIERTDRPLAAKFTFGTSTSPIRAEPTCAVRHPCRPRQRYQSR